MSLEINYIDAPDGAQESAAATAENGNFDPKNVLKSTPDKAWATLEPGIWKLDGTRSILPDSPAPGWWSGVRSGVNQTGILGRDVLGNFTLGRGTEVLATSPSAFVLPPRIIISFPVPYATTGFTFTFSESTNQYCPKIHVKWYNGNFLLLDKDYFPDGPKWTLEEVVESFDRIEVELLTTNLPGHFAKIQRIEIGRNFLFDADEIINCRLVTEIDQSLCELTADTMTFEFYDHEGRNFLPQQNQKVELIKNGELLAVQYITGSTRKAKANYTIKCQSAIGLLTDQFLGGLYVDKPVPELVAEILNRWDHEIASVFTGMTVTGYLPVCTQRDALQQVAFAIGAMVTTQGSSLIRLVPLPASVTSRFLAKDIFLGGKVDSSPRFARVEINSHSYTPTDDVETLLDEEEVEGTDVLLTFTTPHHSYEITGGTITASDVNWVTVTASGPVTLTAKTYLHATRVHTKRNLEATAKERGNYVAVTECTLINAGNVQSALDRLYSAKQRRQKATYQAAVTNQRTGEIGSGITPWNTTTTGFISSMESTLTQTGHMATVEIQGTETVAESVWFYSGEIYSGGQEVVY